MSTAATIRIQVEASFAQRVPAALTLKIKQAPELFPTGMAEVDAMLPDEFEVDLSTPLMSMAVNDRMVADFFATGFTLGLHAVALQRPALDSLGVMRAADPKELPDGTFVRIAGAVIARQRPGTASGFIFLSNKDETGISNAITRC